MSFVISRQVVFLMGKRCELVHIGYSGDTFSDDWYGKVYDETKEHGFDLTLGRPTELEALQDLDKLVLGESPYDEQQLNAAERCEKCGALATRIISPRECKRLTFLCESCYSRVMEKLIPGGRWL